MFDELKRLAIRQNDDMVPLFSVSDSDDDNIEGEVYPDELPLLALKNTVLFPGQVIPITIGRKKSLKALKAADKAGKLLAVIAQRETNIENPDLKDLFEVGTVARIIKVIKMPDGNTTAILQGRKRFHLDNIVSSDPYLHRYPQRP